MSNRSLLEFNHDFSPTTDVGYYKLGLALANYMRAADERELPPGVIRKYYRHHTHPEAGIVQPQPKNLKPVIGLGDFWAHEIT